MSKYGAGDDCEQTHYEKAVTGKQAAARPGYYLAQGGCYYKYPSGQYAQVDPRNCY